MIMLGFCHAFFKLGFNFVVMSSLLSHFYFIGLQIQRLSGVDSDFAPFVQHAGVPSIDMYYGRGMYLITRRFCMIDGKSKACGSRYVGIYFSYAISIC